MSHLKVCSKCGEEEEHNKGQTQCKKCYKKWYATYKDVGKRNQHYKYKFGITLDDYNVILNEQGGVCGSCGGVEVNRYKSLAVDHDHETGKIRGLLCSNCNRAAGLVGDTADGAYKLYKYLKENE